MKLCWEAMGGAPGSCVRGPLTYVTADRDTTHELRPRLFLYFCCQLPSTLGHFAPALHVFDNKSLNTEK